MYEVFHGTLDDGEFPAIVYKYRNWDAPHHNRFITEREVFMASPSSFEDPFDCKIPIRYDLLNNKQTLSWSDRLSKIANPGYSRQQHRKASREWAKQKLFKDKTHLDSYKTHYFTEYDKRLGILSLTAEPCLEKMWTKYANDSEGICIGYNSRLMFEFLGGGGKVSYLNELPIILPEPVMNRLEIRSHQLFAKEEKWNFENEYRTHKFWPDPVNTIDRQIKLPKEAFNRVILGKNISAKNRQEIINAVKDNIGDIPIIEQLEFCPD
ncbi:MAG: DUF2971 domain-containing protein [Bacteroidota bacterium]